VESRQEINYLTDELYRHYCDHGKILSQEILDTLSKNPLELSKREKEVFVRFVLPRRQQIKQALKTRFIHSGARREVWYDCLLSNSQSVIGQIAVEMLLEEEALAAEPLTKHAVPLAPQELTPAVEPSAITPAISLSNLPLAQAHHAVEPPLRAQQPVQEEPSPLPAPHAPLQASGPTQHATPPGPRDIPTIPPAHREVKKIASLKPSPESHATPEPLSTPQPPGEAIPPKPTAPLEVSSISGGASKEAIDTPDAQPEMPSYRFPGITGFEDVETLSRRRSRRKTASSISWGILIGVIALMAIIGFVAGHGSWWKSEAVNVAGETALPLEITNPAQDQSFNTPNITVSGVTIPDADVLITLDNSGRSISCRSDAQGAFSADIVLAEGSNSIKAALTSGNANQSCSLSCQYAMDSAAYEAACQSITYESLTKNLDAYEGQRYSVTGSIDNISVSGESSNILLNVTKNKYGVWNDTVCVSYAGAISARKFSIVTIYGEIQGWYSTSTSLGKAITVPLINARFIDVVQR
jgi:Glucodextranase, domain B